MDRMILIEEWLRMIIFRNNKIHTSLYCSLSYVWVQKFSGTSCSKQIEPITIRLQLIAK